MKKINVMYKLKKTVFLTFIITAMTIAGKAQNGGLWPENNVAKIVLTNKTTTQAFITVFSKQISASDDYRISYGTIDTVIAIPGSGSLQFIIPISTTKFKVKAITTSVNQPDMGWLELLLLEALPVKIANMKARLITPSNSH